MVKHDQRYTVDEALRDSFFRNNAQLQQDIQELEEKLGKSWISPLMKNILLQSQESFDYYSQQSAEKDSATIKRSA